MRAIRVALFSIALGALQVTFAQTQAGKRDAGGYPAPTAELERGRTIYVVSSCHFCHGIDLTGAAMGAADLMHLPLVGRDEGGNLIGPIVLKGLPNLQTAMPSIPITRHNKFRIWQHTFIICGSRADTKNFPR